MTKAFKEDPEIAEYWAQALDSNNGIEITFKTVEETRRKMFMLHKHRKALENQAAESEFYMQMYRIPEMYSYFVSRRGDLTLRISPKSTPPEVIVL